MPLNPHLRSSLPRRLATDAESANTRRDGKEGAEASGQAADPPRVAARALPYRAANGTCKVQIRVFWIFFDFGFDPDRSEAAASRHLSATAVAEDDCPGNVIQRQNATA